MKISDIKIPDKEKAAIADFVSAVVVVLVFAVLALAAKLGQEKYAEIQSASEDPAYYSLRDTALVLDFSKLPIVIDSTAPQPQPSDSDTTRQVK